MQQVHFCSGATFITGDAIAMSLLRYARAVSALRRSDVVTVPTAISSGGAGAVTLLLTSTSQISAATVELAGPELVDEFFVDRLDALTTELLIPGVWEGAEPDPSALRV